MSEIEVGASELVDRQDYIERAMRALSLSGRRLARTDAGWRVLTSADRRGRGRLLLTDGEVGALVNAGLLRESEADMYVLADVVVTPKPSIEPWAFMVATRRDPARERGKGFSALAWRARKGEGPLTMRHVEAGLRLIQDVEQRENSRGLTMNWETGPVDRQRRSGASGGFRGIAAKRSERIRRVKRFVSVDAFGLVWALCIEAMPIRALRERFGIGRRQVDAVVAEALEEVALAYDRCGA